MKTPSDHKTHGAATNKNGTRFQSLFEHMLEGVAVYEAVDEGEDFVFCDMNRSGEQIFQVKRKDIVGRRVTDVFPGIRDMGLLDAFRAVWKTGESTRHPVSLYQDDRISQWVENSIFKLPDGEIVAVFGDVTDRVKYLDDLQESRQRLERERTLFQTIIDTIPVMITRYDPEANMLYLNKAFEETTGWTTEEAEDIDFLTAVYPDPVERQRALDYMQAASVEWKAFLMQSKSGEVIESEWSNIRLADGTQIGIGIDLAERKELEKGLRKSNELLDATGQMARVGGWELDADTLTVTWTDETYRIHEVPVGQQPPLEEAINFFHPDDRKRLSRAIELALKEGQPYDMELRFITAKGNHLWTRTACQPEMIDGRTVRLRGTFQDITELHRVQEENRETLRLLEFAIEQIPIPVIVADAPDVTISHINQAAVDLLTIVPEDVTEIPLAAHREFWPTFYPDGTPYRVEDLPLTRAIQRGDVTHSAEIIVRRRDGDHHISASAAPLRDESGKIIAGIVAFPDITEQKRAEKALWDREERLNLALEGGELGTWDWDVSTDEIQFGKRWAEMKGYALHEIKPHLSSWEEMVHPEDLPGVYDVLNAHLKGETAFYEAEFRMRHKSGEWVWILDKGKVIERDAEGQPVRVCGTHLDITKRKRAEQELKRYHNELEKRVKSRTAELQSANKELEAFVYSVSHDLRAPLRAITGFAEIIARRHRESLNEEGRHYFDNILEAGNRMGDLISDLLTFSRLGRAGLPPERIELTPIMENIRSDLEPRRVKTGAEITLEGPLPDIQGVRALVVQIFTNLMDNALKYRREGVQPRIDISGTIEGGGAVIEVVDNGLGIAPEHQEKIFNIFQRLHSRDDYSGTGVGLAIVKKAAALMGGSVGLESEPGKGSVFRVTLPLAVP